MEHIIQVGKKFDSSEELDAAIKAYQRANCVNLYKKEARTIEAGRKKAPNRNFRDELKYFEIAYACVKNGKYKQKLTTGERALNQRTVRDDCEFVIKVRTSVDGQQLVISSMNCEHKHGLSEAVFNSYHSERRLKPEDVNSVLEGLDYRGKILFFF